MIKFLEDKNIWILETANTAYVFGIWKDDHIKNLYWGKKLIFDYDYPDFIDYPLRDFWLWDEEISVRGEANFVDHCIKVEYFDGVRDLNLKYKKHSINENILEIFMLDEYYNFEIILSYNVLESFDIIERKIIAKNLSDNKIKLEDFKSSSVYLPAKDCNLNYLTGMWAHESRLQKEVVSEGKRVLESRHGHTSAFANPFFAIDYNASEDYGDVYFGLIAWSGNWKITVQKQMYERIAVVLGMNEWDFSFILDSNEFIESPVVSLGFSEDGFTKMSQILHRYQMDNVMPQDKSHEIRKVLYNSWEATTFNVTEDNQKLLAKKAADIGVELFVVDDGWFGKRYSDNAGLGDWYINKEKFPNGLKPLIDYVNSLGMDFGLWVEPEMVNPDSDLYRNNPDWVVSFPNRPRTEKRNQLILNLAKTEVKDFIIKFMSDLLSENNIKFIKWDMNRPFYESGWSEKNIENQREIWYYYTKNLYDIWEILREKFPHVTFESCSSGGARVDHGILKYADQVWTSDNTDPFDRQVIQEGFSYAYNSKIMVCWVTDWGGKNAYPIEYRFHSAMMGTLGIGADLNKYSSEELNIFKDQISLYKDIRNIIQNGYQYRLLSTKKDNHYAIQYLSRDKNEGVLIFLKNPEKANVFGKIILTFKGLEASSIYCVEGYYEKISGLALMKKGIAIDLRKNIAFSVLSSKHFDSKVIKFKKIGK